MSHASNEVDHREGPSGRRSPRAMTLPELLVSVAIVLLIFSLVLVAARTVQASSRRTRAQAQLQLLAAGIERYAAAWPLWRDASGTPVADRAWPHWSSWALFPVPPYDYTSPLCGMLNPSPPNPTPISTPADDDDIDAAGQFIGRNDVGQASACLAYALTTPALGRTIMKDDNGAIQVITDREYPALGGRTTPIRISLDPWGHPLRYLWVIRDADPTNPSGWRAISCADPTVVGVNDPNNDPYFARAQGFVLESAGPDGRFGYQWKRNPTAQEMTDAADNLLVRP